MAKVLAGLTGQVLQNCPQLVIRLQRGVQIAFTDPLIELLDQIGRALSSIAHAVVAAPCEVFETVEFAEHRRELCR